LDCTLSRMMLRKVSDFAPVGSLLFFVVYDLK